MAKHIPETFINDLLLKLDIVEVIDQRVPLRKSGANMVALCPFHNEKSPSFTVSPSKQFFHCFGCGKHGNAISFLMELDRLEFVEAIEQLASLAGLAIPYNQSQRSQQHSYENLYDIMAKAQQFYQQQLSQHVPAKQYLRQRRLHSTIIEQFSLGFAPDAWSQLLNHFQTSPELEKQLIRAGLVIRNEQNRCYDRFRNRIMFPIRDRKGRVVGFGGRVLGNSQPKYLNSPETPIFHKGSGDLYGLFELLQSQRDIEHILVVEGYMDLISLVQHDIKPVVATLGTATTRQHLERLFRYSQKIIFCFDGDSAGRSAAWRALETVIALMEDGRQAKFLFLPEGEDPDSVINTEGSENFKRRIDKAIPLAEFLFNELRIKTDPSTIDGRAAMSKLAIPILQKIPKGAYQQLMAEELSRQIRIDKQKIQTLITGESAYNKSEKMAQRSAKLPGKRLAPIQLAISFLLQYPHLAKLVDELDQIPELTNEDKIFKQLLELIHANPNINTGTIIQHWHDSDFESILSQLATVDHIITVEGIEQEFTEILKGLTNNRTELNIEILMQKAMKSGLTNEEKLQLQQLITDSKRK